MRRALSVHALFGQTETELRQAFAEDCAGVTSVQYTVTYNRSGLLGLTVSAETMGAYSASEVVYLTFALASGRSVRLDDLLTPAGKRRVVAQFGERIRTRVTQLEATVEAEGGDSDASFHELLNSIDPSVSDFSVTEAGILLMHDFDFPHYMLASEPDGSVFFTWAQLGNALAPAGLLADRRPKRTNAIPIPVDMFRVENERLAEHWDAGNPSPASIPSGHTLLAGPTDNGDLTQTDASKALVRRFAEQVLVARSFDGYDDFFNDGQLVQHDLHLVDGAAALRASLESTETIVVRDEVLRVLGEGELVAAKSQAPSPSSTTPFAWRTAN